MEYHAKNQLAIDDVIYDERCKNDDLHPSDYIQ